MPKRKQLNPENPFGLHNEKQKVIRERVPNAQGILEEQRRTITVGSIRNWLTFLFEKYKNTPRFSTAEGRRELINVIGNTELAIKKVKVSANRKEVAAKVVSGTIATGFAGGLVLAGAFLGGIGAIMGMIGGGQIIAASQDGRWIVETQLKEDMIMTLMDQLRRMNGGEEPEETAVMREGILLPELSPEARVLTADAIARMGVNFVRLLGDHEAELEAEGLDVGAAQGMALDLVDQEQEQAGEGAPLISSGEVWGNLYRVMNEQRGGGGGGGGGAPPPESESEGSEDEDHGGALGGEIPALEGGLDDEEDAPLVRARPRASSDSRVAFAPTSPRKMKKGGIVKGKRDNPVPIIAHEGELIVPKRNVPAVLHSSAWKNHIEEIARSKKLTFAQAKQYALGNRTMVKKTKPKKKSYMSDSSDSDW